MSVSSVSSLRTSTASSSSSSAASELQRARDERVLSVLMAKDKQIADMEAALRDLQTRCDELVSERDQFESEAATQRARAAQAESTAAEREAAQRRSQETIRILQAELRSSRAEDDASRDVARMRAELDRKGEQMEELIRELQQARSSATSLPAQTNAQQAHATWLQEREEMSNLILDQQQRLEAMEVQAARATRDMNDQIARLQNEVADQTAALADAESRVHAADAARREAERALAAPAPAAAPSLAQSSAILASKQREVEELRANLARAADTERTLRDQLATAAATAPASQSGGALAGSAAALDSLRAQLLLVESELSSKSHALSLAQLETRELAARLHQSDEYAARARSAVQASEARVEEVSRRCAALQHVEAQLVAAQRQAAELESKLSALEARERTATQAAAAVESRLEAQARETESLYQAELGQLKRMLRALLAQAQNACGGAGGDAGAPPLLTGLSGDAASPDLANMQDDFQSVLASLSSLTASRDLHKLSSVRLEKRIQFLERQAESFQTTSIETARDAQEQSEAHRHALEAEQRAHVEARDALEQKLSTQAQEVLRLQHTITQGDAQALKLQQALDDAESRVANLTLQVKRAAVETREARTAGEDALSTMRAELAHANSVVSEKTAQIDVLMDTIEALQRASAQEDRATAVQAHHQRAGSAAPLTSASPASAAAFNSLTAKLISFAAQLSHAKAQEAVLRRAGRAQESLVQRWRSAAATAESEVDHLRHETVPALESQVHALTAKEKASRLEASRLAGQLSHKSEEVFALNAALAKSGTQAATLQASIDTLHAEAREAQKRHIEAVEAAQADQRRTLQEYAKQFGGRPHNADDAALAATVTHLTNTAGGANVAPHHSLAGPALVAALKELTTSIAHASSAVPHVQAQLFSPFTPQKKRRPTAAASASPQFVLHSPSSAASATVPPSSSESAAVLPAIFERLLNILLSNESALLHSEQSVSLAHFQLTRLSNQLLAKESEAESLRHAFGVYERQHEALLRILRQKNDLTQSFLRDQQAQASARVDELQATLFDAQNDLLASQASESHRAKHVEQLRARVQHLTRQADIHESESAQKILQVESRAEKSLLSKWRHREEEVKLYVEQSLRPMLLGSGHRADDDANVEVSQQLANLSATITALKLVESSALGEVEAALATNAALQQQVDAWKAECAALEARVRDGEEQYIAGAMSTSVKRTSTGVEPRSNASVAPIPTTTTASEPVEQPKPSTQDQPRSITPPIKRSSRAPRSPSPESPPTSISSSPTSSSSSPLTDREHRRSPRRGRTESKSRTTRDRRDRDRTRDRSRSPSSDRARSRSRARRRAASPASQNRFLRSQVSYLESREQELVAALRQSTRVQEQLEDTIEELIAIKRAFDAETRAREQEDAEQEEQKRAREREEEKRRSKSSSSSRSALTTVVPAASSSKPAKKSSRSSRADAADESATTSSLAQTVLEVTKQLRDREAAATEKQAELAKTTAELHACKAEAARLQAQLSQRQADFAHLQAQLTSKTSEAATAAAESANVTASGGQLRQQLAQLESTNADLRQQVTALQSQSTASANKLASELRALQNELLPSGVENTSLKSQLQSLQQRLDHSLATENAERQRSVELAAQIKAAEVQRAHLAAKANEAEKERIIAQDELDRLQSEAAHDRHLFEEEIKSREKEKIAMKNMLTSLDQSRADLHSHHEQLLRDTATKEEEYTRRIRELEASVTRELEERRRVNEREQDFLDRIQSLEHAKQSSHDTQLQQSDTYQADLAAMKQANTILESTLEECKAELETLSTIQDAHDVLDAELKSLRCQHMDMLDDFSREREESRQRQEALESEVRSLSDSLDARGDHLAEELAHQKALYTEMIDKLKHRIHQLQSEVEDAEGDASTLEAKLAHLTDLNVANASARVRAEEERDLLVARFEELERARDAAAAEAANRASVESEIAAQEFRQLKNTFEEFRRGHEALVAVYQDQHGRIMNRLKKALEAVADAQQKRDAKPTKPTDKLKSGVKSEKESAPEKASPPAFTSDLAKGRLVFDMAELLSSLSEREAVVRSLTAEVDQYKRALAAAAQQNAQAGKPAPPAVARPLTSILTSNANAHPQGPLATSQRKKTPLGHGTASTTGKDSTTLHVNLTLEEVAPLSWSEERSLAVLGGELAHMELQLKTAQRQSLSAQESAIHFEEQWKLGALAHDTTKEKLRAANKDLHALQRQSTGATKAYEAEMAKMAESLRTEEEWSALMKAVADGKHAVKAAKEDLARRGRQLTQANDDLIRLKTQLEDLEASNVAKEAKAAKAQRSVAAKDAIIADLRRKFEEQDADDKAATDASLAANDKLRSVNASAAKKEATIRELRAKLDQAAAESQVHQEQAVQLAPAQAKLKQTQKDLTAAQRKLDDVVLERDTFSAQCRELESQLDLWRTKAQLQTAGQENDLAKLAHEAQRIGAAYETVRNLVRDMALSQVEAIDALGGTLADLERRSPDDSLALDADISVRDVQTLSVAAEFSKEDLEDILSTTLRVDSNRPAHTRSRASVYARRLLADLEVWLARDLSMPSVLQRVRVEFTRLIDERVRLELLVLAAASKDDTTLGSSAPRMRTGTGTGTGPASSLASSRSRAAASTNTATGTAAQADLDAANARVRALEEQLRRHDIDRASRVASVQQAARVASDIERGGRERASSPISRRAFDSSRDRDRPTGVSRFTAHIYDERERYRPGSATDSISSIDSRSS